MLLAGAGMVKDVAAKLNISARTAEVHRHNIMRKLGLHHRTELVVYSLVHGLVTLDELGARYGFNPS